MTTSGQATLADRDVELLERTAEVAAALRRQVAKRIVGQHDVVEELLIALLANGHALLVGVPGLAKTLLVSDGGRGAGPGLQPHPVHAGPDADGHHRHRGHRGGSHDRTRVFRFVKGPIFANVVLADEINRTPPKTQAALLQAMQERAVTAAGPDVPPFPALLRARDAESRSSRRARTRSPRRSSTASCSSW
jgi:MoxR-like ATPase